MRCFAFSSCNGSPFFVFLEYKHSLRVLVDSVVKEENGALFVPNDSGIPIVAAGGTHVDWHTNESKHDKKTTTNGKQDTFVEMTAQFRVMIVIKF